MNADLRVHPRPPINDRAYFVCVRSQRERRPNRFFPSGQPKPLHPIVIEGSILGGRYEWFHAPSGRAGLRVSQALCGRPLHPQQGAGDVDQDHKRGLARKRWRKFPISHGSRLREYTGVRYSVGRRLLVVPAIYSTSMRATMSMT